jgi:hypothetical protein
VIQLTSSIEGAWFDERCHVGSSSQCAETTNIDNRGAGAMAIDFSAVRSAHDENQSPIGKGWVQGVALVLIR